MTVSGCSMYLGAALGIGLFDHIGPAGVAWLRIVGAALVLVVIVRPRSAAWNGRTVLVAGSFGTVTALMNIFFYEAIARIPLGTAVAVEFVGPIVVAAWGSRSRSGALAVVAGAVGVVLIADVQVTSEPLGVVFALTAAACWAGYIVLGKRVSSRGAPMESLAVGFAIAAVVTSPILVSIVLRWDASTPTARVLVLGLALGVLSTVVPYSLDQVILRKVGQAQFALLLALLPVAAVVVGLVVLRQVPTVFESAGIGLVVVALVLSNRAAAPTRA
ncbi:EamA family transporter [Antrihabitans cavernicola]|uniref:EamA family transporter n=1 Tax=Antrihabitans cavernicola TaxID=2495913 RepID=A0A5A7SDX4_9NOCA|nr:EamA family transporter [Spelaeibacter cavernicola]